MKTRESVEKVLKKLNKKQRGLKSEIKTKQSSYNDAEIIYKKRQKKLSKLEKQIDELELAIEDIEFDIKDKHSTVSYLQKLEEDEYEPDGYVNLIDKYVEYKGHRQKLFEKYYHTIDNLKQLKNALERLQYLKGLYSRKGVKSDVIGGITTHIATISSVFAGKLLGDDNKIELTYEKDKINIWLWVDDSQRKYEHLSGGQQSRVKLAIDLAFSNLIPHNVGLIVIDEIEYLDENGFDKVFTLMRNELVNRTLIAISHNPKITNYFDEYFTVKQDGGKSYINW